MSEATYNSILRAAATCFSRKGFSETTMDMVAEEAGTSKGALYWHFKSKEELFTRLKEQNVAKVLQELRSSFTALETFDSKLSEGSRLYFSSLKPSQRGAARLNMEFWAVAPRIPKLSGMLNDQYDQLQAFFRSVVEAAVEKGELRDDLDPELLVTILLATLDGLELHWAILERNFNWQKLHAAFCDIILNGVKAEKKRERL
jgi:AcrR family transcriptional regulator